MTGLLLHRVVGDEMTSNFLLDGIVFATPPAGVKVDDGLLDEEWVAIGSTKGLREWLGLGGS